MAGQICWNVENSWFNTFVYAKIAPDPSIIAWMVGVSAAATTLSTFLIGTWSDRIGRRKPFIFIGYILWGIFTVGFGTAQFIPKSPLAFAAVYAVAMDAISLFTLNDSPSWIFWGCSQSRCQRVFRYCLPGLFWSA